MDFTGKSVLITGASSGIGYEISKILSREKCKLAILARREDKLAQFASKYSTGNNNILPIKCDVSKKEEIYKAIEETIKKFGGIDVAILNAGTSERKGIKDLDAEAGEEIIKVNLVSNIYFTEKLAAYFIKKKEGIIVGVSSLADTRGFPRSGAYNASKAGFTKLLESLRIELKEYGIKIITIRPGFIKTAMTDKNEFYMPFLMDAEKAARIIVNGIKKEKRKIQFPWPTAAGAFLLSLLPDTWFEYFARKHLEGLKRKGL